MRKKCLLFCVAVSVLVAILLPAGCQAPSAGQPAEPSPVVGSNCVPAQAVVHYFLEKDRHYFTQQQHTFCPGPKSLVIESLDTLLNLNLQIVIKKSK